MHHLAVVAVVPGSVVLSGGLLDVVLRELWNTAFLTPPSLDNSGRVFPEPKKELWQNEKTPRCRWDRL